MKKLIMSLLLLISMGFSNVVVSEEHLFVVSGVVVNSDGSEKIINFIKMIEAKSGYKLKPYYVNSYSRLSEVLRQNPQALAWTCGAPYVEDSIKDGQQLIAVPLFNGVPTYSSFIVTRKTEKGKKLSDFSSRVFVYSDKRSNSGYVAPAKLLKESGKNIDDFFRVKILAGTHEKSIDSIYRGLADVGAIDEYVWVEYIKRKPHISEKLHVIQKTGPYPFTPIVAGKNVNKKDLVKIKNALISMNKEELMAFKKDFSMDGFVNKEADFYDPIKENMKYIGVKL